MPPLRSTALAAGFLAACVLLLRAAAPSGIAELKNAFAHPPDDARIMMRWWWFGPAVVKPELERELIKMKEGGIGGVEIQPVYPVVLDDPARGLRNFAYLSDEFLDDVRFAAGKARELGLRVDITLGSGWPYGGPRTPIDLAAGRLRVERVPVPPNAVAVAVPALRAGERPISAFLARGDARQFSAEGIRPLGEIQGSEVRVPADAAPGSVVLFFISSRTGQAVKRAAVGAEGPVLDHYNHAAIDRHLSLVADRLMQAFGSNPPHAVFSDSLEVYSSDWTPDFLQEFRKRRGYDLAPDLPALAGDIGPRTAAIRHDWGKTLTELANDNYLTPVRDWAHRHGTLFRSQTYGTPPVTLSSNALVDLPEGEGSQWRSFSTTRWASSANHLLGNPVTSSETWTWLHSPVFRATPLDMKAEADIHFLQGVNQLIGHGWPYSPEQVGEPGWHFYAAAVFNQHNPWWMVMPDIAAYLQRVSYLLRQGQPVSDIAVYLPTSDAYSRFTLGNATVNGQMPALLGPHLVPQILDAGYSFDFIDDGMIARGGIPHPVLILPGVERIPLESYREIEEYLRKGGIVIATRRTPSQAPGVVEAGDAAAIRELSRALFEAPGARGRLVADEAKLGEALRAALAPDVTKAPEIGFVHRKLPFAEVYFLANTSNHPVHAAAGFRVKGLDAAWWSPFTGKAVKAEGGNRIDLNLAPYESRVLVFSNDRLASVRASSAPAPAAIDLSAGWKVSFPGASQPVAMDRLVSWTELAAQKYFSGRAAYEKTVAVPASFIGPGRTAWLNFGEGTPVTAPERRSGSGMRSMLESPVREAAMVHVNGKPAGSIWRPPYELDVTALLRAGQNAIRIEVANLAINTLSHQPLPDPKPLIAKYGDRFQDQDMQNLQPLPSGLLGGVHLIAK